MNLDNINNLKAELLNPQKAKIRELATMAQGGPSLLRSESRLAVGYSRVGQGYRLEVRVQKEDGPAAKKAHRLQQAYPNDVVVAVLESAQVVPTQDVMRSTVFSERLMALYQDQQLCLGSSVSHRDETAPGTLGAFVQDIHGKRSILSCSHVLARSGEAPKGKPNLVVHPGAGDVSGGLNNEHSIGKLGRFSQLSTGVPNSIDAAFAYLDDDVPILGNEVPEGVGAPGGQEGKEIRYRPDLVLGEDESMAKIGRTTGYTEGILSALSVDNVPVLVHGIGIVYFDDCLEVRWASGDKPFTSPGDSGAVVFASESRRAVSLHFAGGEVTRQGQSYRVSFSCSLAAIFENLKLNWLED